MTPRGNEESKVRSKLKVGSTETERVRGKERERQMGRDNTRSVKVREPTPSRAYSHDRGILLFILVLTVCTTGLKKPLLLQSSMRPILHIVIIAPHRIARRSSYMCVHECASFYFFLIVCRFFRSISEQLRHFRNGSSCTRSESGIGWIFNAFWIGLPLREFALRLL